MAYTTIKKPSDYFNTKLYTGNSSTNNITGVGFQPDWVWLKDRDSTEFHNVFDIVRGITANRLYTNSTTVTDGYDANALQSFDSDGFTLGSGGAYNNSGNNFASWNWLASNTTASNTDGDITSTVSANTTSGFSIVKYSGNSGGSGYSATIGHGLGVAPSMVIVKCLTVADGWFVYHKGNTSAPETDFLRLDKADATVDQTNIWYDTAPTSSVFTVGIDGGVNQVGRDYIAYCFAEKTGYSKFGSYVGNGNVDGPFIYTGFKPAFVIYKNIDTGYYWKLIDNKTNTGNGNEGAYTHPNTTDYVNSSSFYEDFYSNGFKIRNTNVTGNGSGLSYIYMAFAEEPLVGDNPATAR